MGINLRVLDASIRDDLAKVERDFLALTQFTAFRMIVNLFNITPVDTGEAVQGWLTTLDAESDLYVQIPNPIGAGLAVINQARPFQDIHFSNNVFHITFLEEGSSRQAPDGISRPAISQTEQDVLAREGEF